jgi:hypothetical protein
MVWRGIEDARALGRAFSLAHGLLMGSLTLLLLNDGNASSREARPSRKPRPSRRPLWRSLASGKHTLAAAAMTPRRLTNAAIGALGARPARDNALGLRKPTCLHLRHSTVTPYSVRTNRPLVRTAASSGQRLSDIEYFRRYNRPRHPAFCPSSPGRSSAGVSLSQCLQARGGHARTQTGSI